MKRQSFLKGVMVLAAAGIGVKFIGFFYRVILTNLPGYGDEGNGIYGAGFQVYLVLYALSTTGFPAAISRMVAERTATGDRIGAHRVFKVAFWLLAVSGLMVSLLFLICSPFIARVISNERTVYTMLALSPTIFFVSLMAVFRGYFQGMRDMTPQAGSQIVEQACKTLFAVAFAYILMPYGVEYGAAGATLGTTFGAAAGAVYLWSLYSRRKKELWGVIRRSGKKKSQETVSAIVKKLVALSIPISMGAIILTSANIIDLATVIRQLEKAGFSAADANRLYGILTGKCYVLTGFPVTVCTALSTGLIPEIAGSMAVKDFRAVSEKIAQSFRIAVTLCLPASAGLALLAEPILRLLFPGSSDGAFLLAISALSIPFTGLTQTTSGILQGMGKVSVPAAGFLAGAVIKVVINFLLMPLPEIHIKGAAFGTIACYAVAASVNMVFLKRNFRLNSGMFHSIIKPVAATAIMSICTCPAYNLLYGATGSNSTAAVVSMGGSACVYFIVLLLTGGLKLRRERRK